MNVDEAMDVRQNRSVRRSVSTYSVGNQAWCECTCTYVILKWLHLNQTFKKYPRPWNQWGKVRIYIGFSR